MHTAVHTTTPVRNRHRTQQTSARTRARQPAREASTSSEPTTRTHTRRAGAARPNAAGKLKLLCQRWPTRPRPPRLQPSKLHDLVRHDVPRGTKRLGPGRGAAADGAHPVGAARSASQPNAEGASGGRGRANEPARFVHRSPRQLELRVARVVGRKVSGAVGSPFAAPCPPGAAREHLRVHRARQ